MHLPCYGENKIERKGRFYDEENKPETGIVAAGFGSVFCGVRFGTSHRQFSLEQRRHLWYLSGIYSFDCGAPLGAIWEEIDKICLESLS